MNSIGTPGITVSARRAVALALVLIAATLGAAPAIAGAGVEATSLPAIPPNALLTIDQNRTTVVERIVATWGDALAESGAGLTKDQLHTLLTGLRSDQLLAASLAGSLEGLRNVVANALTATAPVAPGLVQTKALGDAADDLVYTPVTPCREVDTRNAGGQIAGGSSRDFKVWVSSGGFAAQGGSATNCNIPANPVAVVVNLAAVSPAGVGNFIAYPTGATTTTSVLNYQSGQLALSNGAIMPVCQPACANQLTIATNGAGADLVMDIVGYFRAPGAPISVADGAITQAKLSAAGGAHGQVLTTDGAQLVWQTLPQIARWDGFVEPIFGGNASEWIFAGGTATVTIPAGAPRRLTAYGVAAMALSSGVQMAEVNICYQNQFGTGSVKEFNVTSFLLLAFTTTRSNYTAGDSVVLPSGTYNVGLCVNNGQGPLAIDANDWSRGWVMMTPN